LRIMYIFTRNCSAQTLIVFQPFTEFLWLILVIEIAIMYFMVLYFEGSQNLAIMHPADSHHRK
jgi:hypothetical protein